MLKRMLTLLLFTFGILYVNATVRYMTVEQNDGKKYSFLLADKPVVTYEDGNLVVNGNVSTSYAISDVKNFHFTEGDESGVKDADAELLRVITIDDNTIRVENALANAKVMLFNINGATIFTTTTDPLGTVTINLPNQKGVYVLTVGEQSIKVIRK